MTGDDDRAGPTIWDTLLVGGTLLIALGAALLMLFGF